MKYFLVLFTCSFLFGGAVQAQQPMEKTWLFFSDKPNAASALAAPQSLLSQRAIDRRERQGIALNETDVPVYDVYVQSLLDLGLEIHVCSKWLNAVSVSGTEAQITAAQNLPYIRKAAPVQRYQIINDLTLPLNNQAMFRQEATTDFSEVLGFTAGQIEQINLDTLLAMGMTGDSMIIAVLDAGFFGVDTADMFSSFWDKEQILGYYNFPAHNDEVFNIWSGYHGSWVMSVIGGDVDSVYSGSAPDAWFYLYRTEIAENEHVVEEDFWMQAAERADSVGADIINSSLGYTEFDDAAENHTWEDLDGNTTVVTNAADMAASKGILVCNSAGNLGDSPWYYISMPADGDSVFTIGGVSIDSSHISFSGYGPTADGRLKPNVVALAGNSAVLSPDGGVTYLSGTSFSSPLIAGACATLWAEFPEATNMDVMHAVEQSAHLYATPDYAMGYGIPDFFKAYAILDSLFPDIPVDTTGDTTVIDTTEDTTTTVVLLDLNPYVQNGSFTVFLQISVNQEAIFEVYTMQGALMHQEKVYLTPELDEQVKLDVRNWGQGIYIAVLRAGPAYKSVQVFIE